MNIKVKIPQISKQIYKEEVFDVLQDRYNILGPLWVNHQMEWFNGVYSAFKDHHKFLIVMYLIKKTLDFYSRNFVKLTFDQFYLNETIEIEKFNIIEISSALNIPKESVRRKVYELQELGVIKRLKKKIMVDRSAIPYIKPRNSVKKISRFLSTFSEMLVDEKILSNSFTSETLQKNIEKHFSFVWKRYYELQIPMLLGYKDFFGDVETFHIFGACTTNQHLYYRTNKEIKMDRGEFIKSMTITNNKMVGLSAMSISDITGIPRATVVRKLQKLVKRDFLSINEKKHYKLTGTFIDKIVPLQNIVLNKLANFSTSVFNIVIL